ncbi:hypothetical protein BH10ACT1_BH10ACT1_02610 [soil metagenome]
MEGLRPLGVGELLDASIRIYRSRFKTLLAAVALPIVPVLIFTSLISWSTQPDLTVDPSTGNANFDGGDLALQLAGLVVTLIVSVVASSIATAACFRSISGAYVGDDPDWKESLRFAFSRFWSVLGLTLLTGLASVLGLLACGFGVLYPMAVFAVAMPALLVEGVGPTAAMGRSRELVKGRGWRTLGIVLLGAFLAAAFQAVVSAPLAALLFTDVSDVVQQVVTAVVTIVATVLVTPFSAALTMALYVDLRVRKEGFDLVLWAQRLGNAPTEGFPAQPGAPTVPAGWGPGWGPPQGYDPAAYAPEGYYGPTGAPRPGGPSRLPPPPPPPGAAGPASTGWAPPSGEGDLHR